jgi:hypothetical protein
LDLGFESLINSNIVGSGAKSLALLQNQWKTSQLGNLINIINGK